MKNYSPLIGTAFIIGLVVGLIIGLMIGTADSSKGLKYTVVNEAQKCADVEIFFEDAQVYHFKLQGKEHRDPRIAPDTKDIILGSGLEYKFCITFCKQKQKCYMFTPDASLYNMFDENGIKYRQIITIED